MNEWASFAVDILRFFDGTLEFEELTLGQHFYDAIRETAEESLERHRPSEGLARVDMRNNQARSRTQKAHRKSISELRAHNRVALQTRVDAVRDASISRTQTNPDLASVAHERSDNSKEASTLMNLMQSPLSLKRGMANQKRARAAKVDFADYITPDIAGLVQQYRNRTDYETIYNELRGEIFAAVAEHEVGHTVGLRHNFQGSYDSINYHDEYWLLREENLDNVDNLADFYRVNQVTTAQEAGEMRQFQYSSMMDYGYSWHSDLKGLGKYDQAAFVFGYTAGTYTPCSAPCTSAEPGFVEIFQKRLKCARRSRHNADKSRIRRTHWMTRDCHRSIFSNVFTTQHLPKLCQVWMNSGVTRGYG